jgi:hypothetical protein
MLLAQDCDLWDFDNNFWQLHGIFKIYAGKNLRSWIECDVSPAPALDTASRGGKDTFPKGMKVKPCHMVEHMGSSNNHFNGWSK